jgi:hypothetical protein
MRIVPLCVQFIDFHALLLDPCEVLQVVDALSVIVAQFLRVFDARAQQPAMSVRDGVLNGVSDLIGTLFIIGKFESV